MRAINALTLAIFLASSFFSFNSNAAAYNKWSWLKGTYWIVPTNGIYSIAQLAANNSFTVIRGQTVFSITDYFNGYFTGTVAVKVTEAEVTSCQFVLGQVTPEGSVYMTMYDTESGNVRNNPVGTMVKKGGKWTMVNQMTMVSPNQSGAVSHWAYMVQSTPKDATWNNLPFVNQSIPTFLSSCPPGPMINNPLNLQP
jgi:hypothetical protein